jgi:hypothetical protein
MVSPDGGADSVAGAPVEGSAAQTAARSRYKAHRMRRPTAVDGAWPGRVGFIAGDGRWFARGLKRFGSWLGAVVAGWTQAGVVTLADAVAEAFRGAGPDIVAVKVHADLKELRHVVAGIDDLDHVIFAFDDGLSAVVFAVRDIGHPGAGFGVHAGTETFIGAIPAFLTGAGFEIVVEVAGETAFMVEIAAPMAAVVPGATEVGGNPEDFIDVTCAGGDDVGHAIVPVEIDLHFAIGIGVDLPMLAGGVELEDAAAPDGQVHLAVAGADVVIPDLLHGRVLLGVNVPLVGFGVEAAGASGGGAPDVIAFDRDGIDDVVHKSAVELVKVIEPAGAEPGQTAAEQAEPDVAGGGLDFDASDHAPGQTVGFGPVTDLFGLLVVAGEAAFGADPDAVAPRVGTDGEDVVVGQTVLGGDLFPLGIDVGEGVTGWCGSSEGENCEQQQWEEDCAG